ALARTESADHAWVDVPRPLRIGKQSIERRRQRQRPQRLHGDEIIEMSDQIKKIVDAFRDKIRESKVAVEGRRDDIPEARKQQDRIDVVIRERTAFVAVREQQ